jgi:hypothetical protein
MSSDRALPKIEVSMVDDIAVLHPANRLFQSFEAKEAKKTFDQLFLDGCKKFIFNFSDCTYISSDGLGVTAACWHFCFDEKNGFMAVVLPADAESPVCNLFEILGLTRKIGSGIHKTIETALLYIRDESREGL